MKLRVGAGDHKRRHQNAWNRLTLGAGDPTADRAAFDQLKVDVADVRAGGQTDESLSFHGRHIRQLGDAVLLRKQGRQQVPFEPDYTGFDIPNAFVVGYGLDYNDEYRHLPYLAIFDGDV